MAHGHNQYPEMLEEIIDAFKGLPGIGRRTSERIALAMVKWQPGKLEHLGEMLRNLPKTVTFCPECGNLAAHSQLCSICASSSRDRNIICVVEDFSQILSIENSAFYKGVYHVLGGKLSPLENKHAGMLKIDSLLQRIETLKVKEVILALSQDVEGQATAVYIGGLLKGRELKITRLARGLPAGSDISYADSATIGAALNGRIPLN
jgi:recombination protein RecR